MMLDGSRAASYSRSCPGNRPASLPVFTFEGSFNIVVKEGRNMRTTATILGSAALALWVAGCGGYGGSTGNPAGPSGNPAPPSDAIVINIVSENGAQSFSPNPSSIPNGRTVVWHNIDRTIHHVVLDDRSVDTGNLEPGAFSAPMTLGAVGGYHCSIHPAMVGTLTR